MGSAESVPGGLAAREWDGGHVLRSTMRLVNGWQACGSKTAGWHKTCKLGDARHFICSLVEWVISHCPPLYTFLAQYTTT